LVSKNFQELVAIEWCEFQVGNHNVRLATLHLQQSINSVTAHRHLQRQVKSQHMFPEALPLNRVVFRDHYA
jgi:hypothetical protein